MTAAWRLVESAPWGERGRNPAVPLALAAHLAVLLAFGTAALLRVTPVPPGQFPEPRPVFLTWLEPPPLEPILEEPKPRFEVEIPKGDTFTAPALGREDASPAHALPDVPASDPLTGLEDIGTLLPGGLGPLIDGRRGSPGGDPQGTGTRPGVPDGDEDADPIPVGDGMIRPVLLHKVAPDYPPVARASRLPGRVLVEAVIARDGSVEEVRVVHASSHVFERAAMEAVQQWRYTPALRSGRPVRVVLRVDVEFLLN